MGTEQDHHQCGIELLAQWKTMWDDLRQREREQKLPVLRVQVIELDERLAAARAELAVLERDVARERAQGSRRRGT